MDRGSWVGDTDNIVVVDPRKKLLLWVPRDLWCEGLQDRVNRGFATGQHERLIATLAEHRIHVQHGICLRREAVERALADLEVTVPVPERRAFWYPLEPTRRIEEGKKLVTFEPPFEVLSGERIHQWIGARFAHVERLAAPEERSRPRSLLARSRRVLERKPSRRLALALPDLDRIERQKVLIRCLLVQKFDFRRALSNPQWISLSSPDALDELGRTRASWRFRTFDQVEPRTVAGREVLVRR